MSTEMHDFIAVIISDHNVPFAQAHGGNNAFFDAFFCTLFDHNAVDDNFYIMRLVAVQFKTPADVLPFSVDARAQIALFGHGFEELSVMPLSRLHHGGQDGHPSA